MQMRFLIESFSFDNCFVLCEAGFADYGMNIRIWFHEFEYSKQHKSTSWMKSDGKPQQMFHCHRGMIMDQKFNVTEYDATHAELVSITIDVDRDFMQTIIGSLVSGHVREIDVILPEGVFGLREVTSKYSEKSTRFVYTGGDIYYSDSIVGYRFYGSFFNIRQVVISTCRAGGGHQSNGDEACPQKPLHHREPPRLPQHRIRVSQIGCQDTTTLLQRLAHIATPTLQASRSMLPLLPLRRGRKPGLKLSNLLDQMA
jgi:hypothetical protein